jgi:WD40 repeat protein
MIACSMQRRYRQLVVLAIVLAAQIAQAGGSFIQTGNMGSPRALHGSALLPDGKVLVVGGIADFGVLVTNAELFDPGTGTFSVTGSPSQIRIRPTTIGLADGRVLVLGGQDDQGSYLSSAELYDPATGLFGPTGDMTTPRYVASAALLDNGKVLVAAGFNRDEGVLSSAELFDPATGQFTATGNLNELRTEPTAVKRLADGRVLIAGGSNEQGPLASAEIYDPLTGSFSLTGHLLQPLEGHSLALLDDGKVLVVGGSDGGGSGFPMYYPQAELFDPAVGTFTSTGSLAFAREFTTATRLPDGRVLIAGGSHVGGQAGSVTVGAAEIYDPVSGTFSSAGNLAVPVDEPTATVLPDRRILFAGGFAFAGNTIGDLPTAVAQLFTPAQGDLIFVDGFDPAAPGRRSHAE